MGNEGNLVAADIQPGKLRSLLSTAQRMGFSVKTAAADAADASSTAALGLFDRVLVDAPCSGLGTLRRNPEIRWHLDAQALDGFPSLQGRILANAAACVEKGGRLLYATCSVMPDENDGVIERFLKGHPDFSVAEAPAGFPAGVLDSKRYLRTFPHRHGTDGFFGALLARR
jgi:16S rRNA (cytosine967-C5)-methyltransferase